MMSHPHDTRYPKGYAVIADGSPLMQSIRRRVLVCVGVTLLLLMSLPLNYPYTKVVLKWSGSPAELLVR